MYSEHKVPTPFSDEDKWFKLTKRQIVILLIAVVISIGICTLAKGFGVLPLGIMISTAVVVVAGFICFMELPDDKYMFGTGVKLEILALRVIVKKFNRVIYSKNYDNEERTGEK